MKRNNVVREKSYSFALRIVQLYRWLSEKQREYVLSKQILRSGTSIGANVEEAIGSQSKKEFIFKIGIAYKEARETCYWLNLLYSGGYIKGAAFKSVVADCEEILRILGTIIKTMKKQLVIKG